MSTAIHSTTQNLQERTTRSQRLPSSAGRVKRRPHRRPSPLDTPRPSPYRASMLLLSRLPWQQHPRLPVQLVLRRILTFMNFYRKVIVGLAARHRLPSMFGFRESVEDGGLMSYGPNLREEFRRAASYVAKILKGAKPSDLPIQEPMTLELVINMKTAKVLGLTVPPSVLLRANEVIR
jgi:hypothetical protein